MKNIFKKFDFEHAPLPFKRFVNSVISFHFRYPYKKIKIIGVTGTSGKTTTTTLLYRIAMASGHKAGLIGTVENFIGDKKVSADFYKKNASFWEKIFFTESFTTPEVWNLDKLLSEMIKEECEYVFIEVSSIGLEENRMNRLKFAGGIFTNLSHDHLDFHKTMESYFMSKKRFFKMLPTRSFALTNIDDEYGLKMLEGTKAHQFSYGIEKFFDDVYFHGEIKKSSFGGLILNFNKIEIQSKLLGKFNAYNLLSAWSTCSLLGFDMEKVKEILQKIEPPTGRFDHFMSQGGVLAVIDYAHKPDALLNVLNTIKEIKEKDSTIICVFGCGGDRDPSKRPKMGRIGVALSDIPIFTSDNPRSEDPNKIIADMMAELLPEEIKKVKSIPDRREAIKEAVRLAKRGDVILCAGKGHEEYQEIKGVKNHFNDMEELKKLLY